MPYDLTEPLVIGISSRALFNLEEENRIYENEGLAAYEEYQVKHESDILQKGSAFQLVKAFLQLNKLQEKRLVEVIVMSRNSPNTSLRIFNSIQDYELDITRAALTGGSEIAPYLRAFKTDLFLSAFEPDVKQAIDSDVAAGKILTGTSHFDPRAKIDQIRIAFDGDAVLFASESERIYIDDLDGKKIPSTDLVNCLPDGTIQTVNSFKYPSREIKQRLGINFKYHYLRHTYGTLMAEMNTPTHLLCSQMGHGHIHITQRYYLAISQSGVETLQNNLNHL